jgi:hypothetical protein
MVNLISLYNKFQRKDIDFSVIEKNWANVLRRRERNISKLIPDKFAIQTNWINTNQEKNFEPCDCEIPLFSFC